MTESDIKKQGRKYLESKGWLVITNAQEKYSKRGKPDWVIIRNGIHVWIEIKRPEGHLNLNQWEFIQTLILKKANIEVVSDFAGFKRINKKY